MMGPRRRKGRRNPGRDLSRNLLHPKRGKIKVMAGTVPKAQGPAGWLLLPLLFFFKQQFQL
jgi:hypothetical protein